MRARFVLAGAIALTVSSALAGASRADVPPSPVEQTCDVERSSALAGACQACEADFLDARSCERMLGPRGLQRHCRSFGVLQWTEVWCGAPAAQASASAAPQAPPASATAPAGSAHGTGSTAAPAPRSGCTLGPSSEAHPLLAASTLALLAMLRRRRRSG